MYHNKELENTLVHESPEDLFKNTIFIGRGKNDPVPDIVGYGHLHTPFIVRFKNKTLFNPGSIGVPIEMLNSNMDDEKNKFSTMISYMILEGEYGSKELGNISFQLVRLIYDMKKEIDDLEKSDMPIKDTVIHNLRTSIPKL